MCQPKKVRKVRQSYTANTPTATVGGCHLPGLCLPPGRVISHDNGLRDRASTPSAGLSGELYLRTTFKMARGEHHSKRQFPSSCRVVVSA